MQAMPLEDVMRPSVARLDLTMTDINLILFQQTPHPSMSKHSLHITAISLLLHLHPRTTNPNHSHQHTMNWTHMQIHVF